MELRLPPSGADGPYPARGSLVHRGGRPHHGHSGGRSALIKTHALTSDFPLHCENPGYPRRLPPYAPPSHPNPPDLWKSFSELLPRKKPPARPTPSGTKTRSSMSCTFAPLLTPTVTASATSKASSRSSITCRTSV